MANETITLVEIDGSHDECLLTQLHALKSAGHVINVVCTQEIRDRNTTFETLVDTFFIVSFKNAKKRKVLKSIKQFLLSTQTRKVIFNTAQGSKVRDLALMLLFSKIKAFGIIHTTRKFDGSFTQKVINWKIKHYFLLSEFLANKSTPPKNVSIDYFYPIRFPAFNASTEKTGKRTIAIIGGVEKRRKDLDGFIDMAKKVDDDQFHFVFLGKSNPQKEEVIQFKKALEKYRLNHVVQLYDSFVSQEEFNSVLHQTTAILPLVHPDTPSADQYFKNQISGAVNVAFGYNIPLLIHSNYKYVIELKNRTVFYDLENFGSTLINATQRFTQIREWMKNDPEMCNETQEKKYLAFLFS